MVQIIECNPEILGGKPIIKGTRIPVDLIYELIGADVSIEEILDDYPTLTREILEKVIEIGRQAKKNLDNVDLDKYIVSESGMNWNFSSMKTCQDELACGSKKSGINLLHSKI